jgi:hypothetical protein
MQNSKGKPFRSSVRALALLPFAFCLLNDAPTAHAQQLLDRVVARVNGATITLSDVNAALGLGMIEVTAPERPQDAARRQLIDRQLMLAEVARFSPPEPAPSDVDAEVAQMRTRAGGQFDALLRSTGVDEQRIRDLARDTLRIQAYLIQRFGTSVQVSEEEVEQYYRGHPEEFRRGGMVIPYEEALPVARERAAALRRQSLIAQWLRGLRERAEIAERP